MGCDIHATVEKKVGDRWVMVNRLHYLLNKTTINRNYRRFAALAGVRGYGPEPKGLPADVSESTQLYVDEWGEDGHSHSFLSIKEAAEIFIATDYEGLVKTDFEKEYPYDYYFGIESPDEHRLVFWFDN